MACQEQFNALLRPPHQLTLSEPTGDNSLVIEHCGRLFKWSELRLPLEKRVVYIPTELRQSRYAAQLQAKLVEAGYEYTFAYGVDEQLRRGLDIVQFKR